MKKLEWACRRGMLELDILLGNFLKEAYPLLDSEDQSLFQALLTCQDQDLFLWLMGKESPNPTFKTIVERIQKHAQTRDHY